MGRLLFLFLDISSGRQINRVCLNIYHVRIQIGGQGGPDPLPPEKSHVIWVSIGNTQLREYAIGPPLE